MNHPPRVRYLCPSIGLSMAEKIIRTARRLSIIGNRARCDLVLTCVYRRQWIALRLIAMIGVGRGK
jgi:hypothetical protein